MWRAEAWPDAAVAAAGATTGLGAGAFIVPIVYPIGCEKRHVLSLLFRRQEMSLVRETLSFDLRSAMTSCATWNAVVGPIRQKCVSAIAAAKVKNSKCASAIV